MQIQYLEIVTPEVDATCAAFGQLHGVTFGKGDPGLGHARTAALANGGMIGVRAPMHESEEPVVRPYLLVEDIEAAVAAAVKAGGEIAHPPLEIPGHGKFAIYIRAASTTASGRCDGAAASKSPEPNAVRSHQWPTHTRSTARIPASSAT